jgi:hypothetical protein
LAGQHFAGDFDQYHGSRQREIDDINVVASSPTASRSGNARIPNIVSRVGDIRN